VGLYESQVQLKIWALTFRLKQEKGTAGNICKERKEDTCKKDDAEEQY
jgi:hypothetical protein